MFGPLKDRICVTCNLRKATTWWSDDGLMGAIHGGAKARCELCCVKDQLDHARKMAATIPDLEKKLKELE